MNPRCLVLVMAAAMIAAVGCSKRAPEKSSGAGSESPSTSGREATGGPSNAAPGATDSSSHAAAPVRPSVLGLAIVEPAEVQAGQEGLARIGIQVAGGYHVQANPASADYLVATTLQLDGTNEVQVGLPRYPQPQPFRLQGSNEDLATYSGRFIIGIPVRVTSDAKPGETTLLGSLRFQACNDRSCLFPDSIPVRIPVRVHAAGS